MRCNKSLLFLGVGTNLGKEFLEKFVNNTPTIEKVITILSLNNCEFNLSIDTQRYFLLNEFKNKYL